MQILIGTSGWQYRDWRERFYPKGVPQRSWLAYYSERFPTVEVNSTFYGLPSAETVRGWRESTPEGFVFAVKASRFITHIRRLRDVADDIHTFYERVNQLGPKLGPALFQLPPTLPIDTDALQRVIQASPTPQRMAFEFRHPSWESDTRVRSIIRDAGATVVTADRPGSRKRIEAVGEWHYLRLHQGARSDPEYGMTKLRPWVQRMREGAGESFVYFNNDTGGAAIRDAVRFTQAASGTGRFADHLTGYARGTRITA